VKLRAGGYLSKMKNCEVKRDGPREIRFRLPDAPPLRGWAVRLKEDLLDGEMKRGFWLSLWRDVGEMTEFSFDAELHMVFTQESAAGHVSRVLIDGADIKTEVVPIGTAPLGSMP